MEQDYPRRSTSYEPGMNHNHMQITSYYGPPAAAPPPPAAASYYDLRSYSSSYAQSQVSNYNDGVGSNYQVKDFNKFKKGKSTSGSSSSSSSKAWSMASDPEFQRKKRVASYKMYSVEGKVKGTFRKSFRWLKDRYTHILYGWW